MNGNHWRPLATAQIEELVSKLNSQLEKTSKELTEHQEKYKIRVKNVSCVVLAQEKLCVCV